MLKLITILNKISLENITAKLLILIFYFYSDSIIKKKIENYFFKPLLHMAPMRYEIDSTNGRMLTLQNDEGGKSPNLSPSSVSILNTDIPQ